MSKATHDAMRIANPDRRPFVLSRSSYLGGQRYAATWTGDNVSSWEHLHWSVPMVLNLGLSGQPFCGPDIGGFAGTPSPELFAHWIGVGAFLPFCRTHNSLKGDQEPWSFGPAVEEIARAALARRYRLLPYLYTAFREAATRGLPVVRPLFFADPTDVALRSEDRSFLLGRDLLVQPQWESATSRDCAIPEGRWRTLPLIAGEPDSERAHPRLRLRDGAILPVGQGGQMVAEAFSGPLTLFVSLDSAGRARGQLYEDAGEGFGYLDGDYLLTTYEARRIGTKVEVSVVRQEGRRPRTARALDVVLLTDEEERRAQGTDGQVVQIAFDS
jgi:alpha-glucosidase